VEMVTVPVINRISTKEKPRSSQCDNYASPYKRAVYRLIHSLQRDYYE